MNLSPVALDLLGLLYVREIPASRCDVRPKTMLLKAGFAEYMDVLTNSRRNPKGPTFTRRYLALTQKGREYYDALYRH